MSKSVSGVLYPFVKLSKLHHPLIRYSSSLRRLTVESVSRWMNSPPRPEPRSPFSEARPLTGACSGARQVGSFFPQPIMSPLVRRFFIQVQVRVQVLFRNSRFESQSFFHKSEFKSISFFHKSEFESKSFFIVPGSSLSPSRRSRLD